MEPTRLAAIYARVSTEEQAKTSSVPSTTAQVEACKKKAQELVIPVPPDGSVLIVKETHSGTDLRWEGTEFMALVRRAQRHEFTDLICLDIDRFCRGDSHAYFEQEAHFYDAGVNIIWVLNDIPEGMPFRNTILSARAEAAHYQWEKIREASMRVRQASAERGDFIPSNIPPFGWRFVEDEKLQTRKDKPRKIGLEPDPEFAPILRHMYEILAAGGSAGSIKDYLEANHIPTPRGAPVWHEASIRRILHEPTNWGERRAFTYHNEPKKDAARRPVHEKSRTTRTRVEGYDASKTILRPIEGLTKDLAMRALDKLKLHQTNQVYSLPDAQRLERGLLFGGRVRCGVCKRGRG